MMKFIQREQGETLQAFEDRLNDFIEQIRAAGMQMQVTALPGESFVYAAEIHSVDLTTKHPILLTRAEVQAKLESHAKAEERRSKFQGLTLPGSKN